MVNRWLLYFLISYSFCSSAMNHLQPEIKWRADFCRANSLENVLDKLPESIDVLEYKDSYIVPRSSSKYPAFLDEKGDMLYCLFGKSLLVGRTQESGAPIDRYSCKITKIDLPIIPALLALDKTRKYLLAIDNSYHTAAIVYSFKTTGYYILQDFPVLEGSFLPSWGFEHENMVVARTNLTVYKWNFNSAL